MFSALFVCLLQELQENYWISGQEDLWKAWLLVQENTINLEKEIKWIYCIVILCSKCINAHHDQAHFVLPSVSNQKDFNQFEQKPQNFGTCDRSCSYLVCIHLAPYELWPPELQSLFQREADAFEEEAVLHATPVPQVVVLPQALVELPHAEWERFPRELMDDEQQQEV